ncbi:MAG: response regulator transcription factor [Tannerellaceae bacterium]|nr:response regulator transcription factor [Tannerellaceae bacterium]
MRTIILADNQEITRAGLRYLCEKMTGTHPVCEVENRKALLQVLVDFPDAVVVLDYTLFDLTSTDDLFILQARFKEVDWALFSEELSEDFIRRVVFSGEHFSVALKDSSLQEINRALHHAIRHEPFICSRITNLLSVHPQEKEEYPVLTHTETEILKGIALGKTTKEIASERYSSIHTITTHRKNIFRKLQVNNVHEATKYALRAGIIDSAEYYI